MSFTEIRINGLEECVYYYHSFFIIIIIIIIFFFCNTCVYVYVYMRMHVCTCAHVYMHFVFCLCTNVLFVVKKFFVLEINNCVVNFDKNKNKNLN